MRHAYPLFTVYCSLFTDYTYLAVKPYEYGRTDTEPIFWHL
jgi:hypothetical protein